MNCRNTKEKKKELGLFFLLKRAGLFSPQCHRTCQDIFTVPPRSVLRCYHIEKEFLILVLPIPLLALLPNHAFLDWGQRTITARFLNKNVTFTIPTGNYFTQLIITN